MDANDFYEEDEPLNKIVAAFERGEKVLTGSASYGQTAYLDVRPIRHPVSSQPSTKLYAVPVHDDA